MIRHAIFLRRLAVVLLFIAFVLGDLRIFVPRTSPFAGTVGLLSGGAALVVCLVVIARRRQIPALSSEDWARHCSACFYQVEGARCPECGFIEDLVLRQIRWRAYASPRGRALTRILQVAGVLLSVWLVAALASCGLAAIGRINWPRCWSFVQTLQQVMLLVVCIPLLFIRLFSSRETAI